MSHNGDQNAKKETGHDPAMAWRLTSWRRRALIYTDQTQAGLNQPS